MVVDGTFCWFVANVVNKLEIRKFLHTNITY